MCTVSYCCSFRASELCWYLHQQLCPWWSCLCLTPSSSPLEMHHMPTPFSSDMHHIQSSLPLEMHHITPSSPSSSEIRGDLTPPSSSSLLPLLSLASPRISPLAQVARMQYCFRIRCPSLCLLGSLPTSSSKWPRCSGPRLPPLSSLCHLVRCLHWGASRIACMYTSIP